MDSQCVCPICQKEFKRAYNVKIHILTVHDPSRKEKEHVGYPCPICHKTFTRAHYAKKHQETIHKGTLSVVTDAYQTLISKIDQLEESNKQLKVELKEQISKELKDRSPTNITNNLNVICVTGHDNYLDMLTNQMGDFNQAIEYIKDCALSDLAGDCKLIEKIYTNQKHELCFTINPKQSTVTYHNEREERVTESREIFGRKLANNLQNSYLKGINYLIQQNLDQKRDPQQLLADYDLMSWNQHIYQLSDHQHQRKLLGHLHLPIAI